MTFEEKKKLLVDILDELESVIRAIIMDVNSEHVEDSLDRERAKEKFINFMLEAFEIKE